jgi:hypothetical protein
MLTHGALFWGVLEWATEVCRERPHRPGWLSLSSKCARLFLFALGSTGNPPLGPWDKAFGTAWTCLFFKEGLRFFGASYKH